MRAAARVGEKRRQISRLGRVAIGLACRLGHRQGSGKGRGGQEWEEWQLDFAVRLESNVVEIEVVGLG